ncbi:hypothetical protein ACQ4PT_053857 [Festuca glaucescens]
MGVEGKKPYVIAVIIQVIYTGMFVVSKAAFNQGMNTYVFIFYRQAAASLLLLPLAILLERMEVVKPRSPSGIAKLTGVALCLAGVVFIAFYVGPSLNPVNHHCALAAAHADGGDATRGTWIKGTFLMLLANVTWSLWIVLQAALLKEYPNKLLVTAMQCVFSAVQCFVVALVAERDFSRWQLRFDVTLLAVLYTGFVVTGVSYYLQAWCADMKGPVFLAVWNPLCFVFTIFCSSFFLGEIVYLGSILGGILLVGGLYSVLWGKSRENRIAPCGEMNVIDEAEEERSAKEKDERSDQEKGVMKQYDKVAAISPAEQV